MANKYYTRIILSGTLVLFSIQYAAGLGNYNNDPPLNNQAHACERACVKGAAPMTCQYHFYLEWYVTMSKACFDCPHTPADCDRPHCVAGDGQRRQFIAINRQLPGPKIEVCEGDTIEVMVSNRLGDGRVAAFHWHGQHQVDSPWMDGVPYVTQCPIMPGQDFKYKFKADPAGTYMYHSHVGLSLSDGVFGPLVVKQAPEDYPNYDQYDHDCAHTPSGDCEFVVLVNDWTKGEAWGDYLMTRWHSGASEFVKSGLLNGKNAGEAAPNPANPGAAPAMTPYEVFTVKPNKKYRFRVINLATTECRYRISVESHVLRVTDTDGFPIKPKDVNAITYFPGERFDFVIYTNQTEGNYWLKGHPIGECGDTAAVYAIINYDTVAEAEPAGDKDEFDDTADHLNPIIEEDDDDWGTLPGEIRVSDLQGYESIEDKPADVTLYLGMDEFTNNGAFNHPIHYSYKDLEEYFVPDTAVLNNISFVFPRSPLLYQYTDVDSDTFCNQDSTDQDQCFEERCHCTHLVKIPKDSLVEIVFVNEIRGEGAEGHPMHVHGHHFHLLGMAKINIPLGKFDAKALNDAGSLPKNFDNPPIKDTVQITGGGYAIVRFTAQPGVWFIHCHIQWHQMDGQAMILQVGEPGDWKEVPNNLPRCGAYTAQPAPEC